MDRDAAISLCSQALGLVAQKFGETGQAAGSFTGLPEHEAGHLFAFVGTHGVYEPETLVRELCNLDDVEFDPKYLTPGVSLGFRVFADLAKTLHPYVVEDERRADAEFAAAMTDPPLARPKGRNNAFERIDDEDRETLSARIADGHPHTLQKTEDNSAWLELHAEAEAENAAFDDERDQIRAEAEAENEAFDADRDQLRADAEAENEAFDAAARERTLGEARESLQAALNATAAAQETITALPEDASPEAKDEAAKALDQAKAATVAAEADVAALTSSEPTPPADAAIPAQPTPPAAREPFGGKGDRDANGKPGGVKPGKPRTGK